MFNPIESICMTEENLCRCGNLATPPHQCPYSVEINDDFESLCTCCEDCQQNCMDDI